MEHEHDRAGILDAGAGNGHYTVFYQNKTKKFRWFETANLATNPVWNDQFSKLISSETANLATNLVCHVDWTNIMRYLVGPWARAPFVETYQSAKTEQDTRSKKTTHVL